MFRYETGNIIISLKLISFWEMTNIFVNHLIELTIFKCILYIYDIHIYIYKS